jgi:hypothetical protein
VPVSDIPLSIDPDDVVTRYRYALGTFINEFTWMEMFLFHLLCAAANVTEGVGQALFSGARADEMTKLVRRCYEASDKQLEPWLERALSQITVLNGVRNQVVHYTTAGIEDNFDEVWASNRYRYPSKTAKDLRFKPEDLMAMANDSRIIIAYLTTGTEENKKPGSMPTIVEGMQGKQPAWHYKSPQPASPGHKSRGTPRKQSRPRRSSPE